MAVQNEKPILTERQSNIELLRIIAMLMIIAYHFVVHGANEVIPYTVTPERIWVNLFSMCGKMGVNLFVLISGYLGISREFSFKKLFHIEGMQLFYSISLMIIFTVANHTFDVRGIGTSLFPTLFDEYWFVSSYIILYLLTPFINRFLRDVDRNTYRQLILLEIILWSLIPFFTIRISTGMYFTQFLWMLVTYTIGAYIGLYHDDLSNKTVIIKFNINWISVFWICIFIDAIYIIFTVLIGRWNPTFLYYSIYASYGSNSPIIIIGAIGIFLYFINIDMGSIKWINSLAASSLPVYMLHENKWFSSWFWRRAVSYSRMMSMPLIILYSLFLILAIYILGHAVNQIRLLLCKIFSKQISILERLVENAFKAVVRFSENIL